MTRPGKAVETAALWTPWKNQRIEKPTNEVRFFHPYHSAWETGSRCSLVSHSYTPLLLLDTQTDSIRPASRGPESREAVSQCPPHEHTAHRLRAAGRTASPRRASQGIEMSLTQRI